MSTCPENDIHSVYLDGELSEEFIAEYESHVASCPECSAKLEKLTRISGILREDARSVVFSGKELDDSFARLQAKMSYSSFKKNFCGVENKSFGFKKFHGIQCFAAGIAAAAALAFIIPRNSKQHYEGQKFEPVARTSVSNNMGHMRIGGAIDSERLSSFLGSDSDASGHDSMESYGVIRDAGGSFPVQKMILDGSSHARPSVKPALADYDVFFLEHPSQMENLDPSHGFSFSVSSPLLKVSLGGISRNCNY